MTGREMMSSDATLRHGRRLSVASSQPSSIDRAPSSSRELLASTAADIDFTTDASLMPPSPSSSSTPSSSPSLFSPKIHHRSKKALAIVRSILHILPSPSPLCTSWLPMPAGRLIRSSGASRVTGTLFGYRKGHVHFSVQEDPSAQPVLLLELAIPTNSLVKEMASGLVRIALECERTQNRGRLFLEPVWSMYCNGRKTGYAIRRTSSESDSRILTLVKAVSMGAGVLPKEDEGPDGELMFMRARFERVIGSKDSEAFYMMNPDGSGGPELSIFLLRI